MPERFGDDSHFVVWMHYGSKDAGLYRDLVANEHRHTVESTHITLNETSIVAFLVEKCAGERGQNQGGVPGDFCASWLRFSKNVPSKSLIA
jgi:hypothetical protein